MPNPEGTRGAAVHDSEREISNPPPANNHRALIGTGLVTAAILIPLGKFIYDSNAEQERIREHQIDGQIKDYTDTASMLSAGRVVTPRIASAAELQPILDQISLSEEALATIGQMLNTKLDQYLSSDLRLSNSPNVRAQDVYRFEEYIAAAGDVRKACVNNLIESADKLRNFIDTAPTDRLALLGIRANEEIEVLLHHLGEGTLFNEEKTRGFMKVSEAQFSEPLLRAQLAVNNLAHALSK